MAGRDRAVFIGLTETVGLLLLSCFLEVGVVFWKWGEGSKISVFFLDNTSSSQRWLVQKVYFKSPNRETGDF